MAYKSKISDDEILKKAKSCWKRGTEAWSKQRIRERESLRFKVPELQWDEAAKAERRGQIIGGQVVPPRPMLSISKIDHPIQLVYNQFVAAKLGVNIHPVSEDATKDTAEVMQGIYRRIERDSNANQARSWGFSRGSEAGTGAYLIATKYDEDAPPDTGDQEIIIERILDQSTVCFDPAAQRADYSDGEWAFLTTWVPRDTFKREYPRSKASGDSIEWNALATSEPDWVRGGADDEDAAVQVCNYWYKQHEYEDVSIGNGETRKRDVVRVWLSKLTGFDLLSNEPTPGQYIPLIPVIGRELQVFDGERRYMGMIEPSMDGQRLYNTAASTFVESMLTEPKNPWTGPKGTFEGFESAWQQANRRNFPYLEYNPTMVGGQIAPGPTRTQVDTSKMQLSLMGIQEADNFIQATTSVYDPSLGKASRQPESGTKVRALQEQSNAGTSHYAETFVQVSLPYEARVILDWIPAIYDRPGRATRIVWGERDETKTVMLNAPFVMGQDERPMGIPEGQEPPPEAKTYDLRSGKYSYTVSFGKSFQSRLQQGAEQIGQVLQAWPEGMPVIGDLLFEYQDIPGADALAKRMARYVDKVSPGVREPPEGGPTKEQAQAEAAVLQQQMAEMQQQLQQAMQYIQTEQAKQQAQVEKARMDNEAKVRIAEMGQQEAASGDALKLAIEEMKEALETRENALDRQLAVFLEDMKQDLEKFKAAHDVGMAAGGAQTFKAKREDGEESDREQEGETSRGRSQSKEPPEAKE